jgi:hypothetical protein
MIAQINTLDKSQILESIPYNYCAHVLSLLNVRHSSVTMKSRNDTTRLLNQKITREETIQLYKNWKRGLTPAQAAKYLKKPDGIAISVLVSMNLRKKGFTVKTEVLLNGKQCDIVAFKGKNSADDIWAIELKSPRDVWQRGINQCEEYSIWSDSPLLAVMGLNTETLMSREAMRSCIGIAVLDDSGSFEIVKEPTWKFQATEKSFEIFTVRELKKIVRLYIGRCPKYNKEKLIDFLFQSTETNNLEKIFREFFVIKVKTSSVFNLTSVESEVLAAYLMRTAFKEVREAGGTLPYIKMKYHDQQEIEEVILSELIERGVLPTLINNMFPI